MKITRHARKRIYERGFDEVVLTVIEEIVTPRYLKNSNQVLLTKKDALEIARVLRITAERVEKHSGTRMILDSSGSTLLTVYREK